MQTNLKSDLFCGYNNSASEMYWILDPSQYNNVYVSGEVGVSAAGGTAGSFEPADAIDISSFLRGLDSNVSRCSPPVPSLESVNTAPLHVQSDDTKFLVPLYTREKNSAIELSSVDYNRWTPLYTEPQNLRHVIPELAAQRGGLSTQAFVKAAWNQENARTLNGRTTRKEGFQNDASRAAQGLMNNEGVPRTNERAKLCMLNLDPARMIPGGEDITGYPGYNFNTGRHPDVKYMAPGKPPNAPNYPFTDITSQQVYEVGAAPCGEQFFYGTKFYDKGQCPRIESTVLNSNTIGFDAYNM